ncbi:TetR/AcrR family transcriptional regulator [Agathobaculum desmolans]|uniref:TetR/AcrR family transcriptional regulator n=1 Tax=Agathobaculum desmolans TaxID=39484 RepID=UPI00248E667B|nr:TetR/AcrR family transcriptional regulator [Agathobaculum desmolans]
MSESLTNRRVQFTLRTLREAMIDLIVQKPLNSITVTDLCAKADINRSTFYLHYRDVHELFEEIEDSILSFLEEQLGPVPSLQTLSELIPFLYAMQQSPRKRKLFYTLCSEQGDARFIRRLHELTYTAFQRGWESRVPNADENQKRLIFSYIVPGVVSVLSAWVQNDLPGLRAEQLVSLLNGLIEQGIASLPADPASHS